MFELDGDFDIDDAFLQDAFQQDSGNLNHSTLENDVGKRTFSEDEQSLCSKRNRVDNVHFSESSCADRYHGILDCGQELSNRFNSENCYSTEQQISDSPEERCSEIATVRSTPDIFSSELPSSAASDDLSSESITHNESNLNLLRDTPNKGTAVVDLNHSIRQRKFPGPAGLLPDKQNSALSSKLIGLSSSVVEQPPQEPLCSQRSLAVFESAPWQKMLQDFGLNKRGNSVLEKFTVSWIKRRAAARQLVGQKVPFLAVVLQSIDCSSPDPCLVLRDKTGEIFGTLHRDVWEQHGGQLVSGAVLVLRQAGVLSTGPAARRHYLNITFNNLLTIYAPTENEESFKETHVHKVSYQELINAVEEWQSSNVKTTKNFASTSSSTLRNSPQQLGTNLWNTPGSAARNLPLGRNNALQLNTSHQDGFSSATSSRGPNISLPSTSSYKVDCYGGKNGPSSSWETSLNERINSKSSGAKSQMYNLNFPASSDIISNPILGLNRTSIDGVQQAYKPKTSLADVHNSFTPRVSPSGTPKSSAFNLKVPISRDATSTPAKQSSETLRINKFTPKVPNNKSLTPARHNNEIVNNSPSCSLSNNAVPLMEVSKGSKFTLKAPNKSLTPARQSNEFIYSAPSSSSSNGAERLLDVPKACKFTPKVPNSVLLTPVESFGTPKSSQFTPKRSIVNQRTACSSSIHKLSSSNPASEVSHTSLAANSSFSNNKSLKEEELNSILGGLDASSLFDDDF